MYDVVVIGRVGIQPAAEGVERDGSLCRLVERHTDVGAERFSASISPFKSTHGNHPC
jgi:hypothetical protein